ncbi:MAG: O-antigen/teichoic acid export membrane protein [Polaribacter sp.]|jgi:O-antigen/teichoic acid export membrane protein
MISFIRNKISRIDTHTLEVIKNASSSTLVKVVGMLASIIVSIILGRTLGADGLGIIGLANRIANLLLIVALFGMPKVLIKEIAIAHNNKNWQHIGNCIRTSYVLNGIISILIVTLFLLLTPFLIQNVFYKPQLTIPLSIAIVMIVPMVFSRIHSSGLIGLRKIWQSNLVEQTLSILVVALLLLVFILLEIKITLINVALMYAIGRITVTLTVGIYWQNLFSYSNKKMILTSKLLKTAIPLFIVSATGVILASSNIIMLGWLSNSTEVGLFTVGARIALLTSFFLQVTNSAVAPKIATLYQKKNIDELEIMIQKVTGVLFFIGLITFITLFFGGEWILGVWGNEFKEAYWTLIILGVGQLINLSTGAVGIILVMTGHEKVESSLSMIFIPLNLFLNFLFISLWGGLGAAIATAISVSGINIARTILVKQKTGILVFPRFFFNSRKNSVHS